MRSIPASVKQALEILPPSTHPMDVLRTGVSVLGCVLPEAPDHNEAGARSIATRCWPRYPPCSFTGTITRAMAAA